MKPEEFGITKYKFNDDGTLDVFENVDLSYKNLTELPFNFKIIDGYFNCRNNNLTSLKNSPKIVNGYFHCSNNNLIILKGAPEIVNGDFICSWNNLKSLNGLNLDNISGDIILIMGNRKSEIKLTEKEKLWMTLNPEKLVIK